MMTLATRRLGIALALLVLVSRGEGAQEESVSPSQSVSRDDRVSDIFSGEETRNTEVGQPSMTGVFLRLIGWTIAVIAVGAAILLLLKRYTPVVNTLNGAGMVHILGRTSLSPRHSIYLVRISNQRLLVLGVSGDQMVTLSEIADSAGILACDSEFRTVLDGFTDPDSGTPRQRSAGDVEVTTGSRVHGDLSQELRPYQREVQKIRSLIGGWRGMLNRNVSAGDDQSRRGRNLQET